MLASKQSKSGGIFQKMIEVDFFSRFENSYEKALSNAFQSNGRRGEEVAVVVINK